MRYFYTYPNSLLELTFFSYLLSDKMFQLSDNAHESRLKEVIEKYLRHNNYSLGGTDVHAAGELVDKLEVNGRTILTNSYFHSEPTAANEVDRRPY